MRIASIVLNAVLAAAVVVVNFFLAVLALFERRAADPDPSAIVFDLTLVYGVALLSSAIAAAFYRAGAPARATDTGVVKR